MKLWVLSPSLLSAGMLHDCWNDALMARKMLVDGVKHYERELVRFVRCENPLGVMDAYLYGLYAESCNRNRRFDKKLFGIGKFEYINITQAYLDDEFDAMLKKAMNRDGWWYDRVVRLEPETHYIFKVVG